MRARSIDSDTLCHQTEPAGSPNGGDGRRICLHSLVAMGEVPMICVFHFDAKQFGNIPATEPCRWSFHFPHRSSRSTVRTSICPGEEMTYLRIHLKVCEGCGSLWFRPQDGMDIYCTSCATKLTHFPKMVKRRPGRPCKRTAQSMAAHGGTR